MAITQQKLDDLAAIIVDYREGQITKPDGAHVKKWLSQFDAAVQESLLSEMDHVLKQTYIPKTRVESFLANLVTNEKLTGGDPKKFWKDGKFLDLQKRGSSQRELMKMIEAPLKAQTGYGVADCGKNSPACFIYLDDGLFSGNTILGDLRDWLKGAAPSQALVHVVVMALHRGGQYYARTELEKTASQVGKKIEFKWWRIVELEDRKAYIKDSDVLRPTKIPEDQPTKDYVKTLKYPPTLRPPGSLGTAKFFSSEGARELLEQQFLLKGVYIRTQSGNFNEYARPLGNMVLSTLGFGSTIVTFRNCPNNAPLALWAGSPWYPLFLRKTN